MVARADFLLECPLLREYSYSPFFRYTFPYTRFLKLLNSLRSHVEHKLLLQSRFPIADGLKERERSKSIGNHIYRLRLARFNVLIKVLI